LKLFEIPFRRLALVLGAAAVVVAVAACGSSSTATTTKSASASDASSSTATGSGSSSSRATLVACLKQHGVTLPSRPAGGGAPPGGGPPAGGGGFFGGSGSGSGSGRGFFRGNPKFAAAFKACGGSSRFGFGRGSRGRFRISHTAIDNYVTCIRQHGYPQMPNPNFSGKGPVFPASIRTNSKFQSASRSCQHILVPARPSGTGGTTTNPSS
jgi:hypothetical protein